MRSQPLSELAGALATLVIYVITQVGLKLSPEASAALAVVITSVVYRVHRRRAAK